MLSKSFYMVLATVFYCGFAVLGFSGEIYEGPGGVLIDSDGFFISYEDTIEVIAERNKKPSIASNIMIETIELTELPAQDLGDALTRYQGIDVTTGGSKANKEIKIRGSEARGVLVSLNGRPMNTGYYGKVDFNDLPVYNIKNVEIIKGPAPARYGINNYSGVVNITTSGGAAYGTGFHSTLSAEFGSGNFMRYKFGTGTQISKLDIAASGSYRMRDGIVMSDDFGENPDTENPESLEDGLAPNSASEQFEGEVKAGYKLSKHYVGLTLGAAKGNREFPFNNKKFDDIQRVSGAMNFNLDFEPIEIGGDIFHDTYYDRYQEFGRTDNVILDSKLWCKTNGVNVSSDFSHDLGTLYFGGGIKFDEIEKKPDTNRDKYSRHLRNHYAFLEIETKQLYDFTLSTGAVFSYFVNDGRGDTSLTFPELGVTDIADAESYTRIDPTISLAYEPLPVFSLYCAMGQYTRYPVIHQLYSSSSGNAQLDPETARKLEIGSRYLIGFSLFDMLLKGSVFYNDFQDMIARDIYDTDETYKNIEGGFTRGYEIQGEIVCPWGLKSSLAMEYLYGSSPQILNYAPRIKTIARIGYENSFGDFQSGIALSGRYYYKRADDWSEQWNEAEYLPDYAVFDSRLWTSWQMLTLELNIQNLMDRNYYEESDYPATGRQIFLRLIAEIPK